MKKFLIILIFYSSIITNAQPFGGASKDYRIKKLDYFNSSGEQSYTIFNYNKDGRLYRALWRYVDNSRASNNYYEHDSLGNIVSAFREFLDGKTSSEIFLYDNFGNKVKEVFNRSDSVNGSAIYKYENHILKTAILENFKGWLTCVIEYHYNNQNQRTKGIIESSGSIMGKIDYIYDSIGNLVTEVWDFNGKWSQTFNYIYEKKTLSKFYYSSPFLQINDTYRISSENYSYNNEKGGHSYYLYNEDGLLYKKVFERNDGFSTNTLYQYDKEKRLVSSKREYSNGEIANFIYQYNECNNLVGRYCYIADTLNSFELYIYNSDGILIKAYYNNFDNWLTGTLTFNADIVGSNLSGYFKGQDGFDATITSKYNSHGNLSNIRWDFSFGKYQEYTYEYETINSP